MANLPIQAFAISAYDLVDYDGSDVATGDDDLDADFAALGNAIADPGIDYEYDVDMGGVTFVDNISPTPTNDVSVETGDLPTDAWFDAAAYKGAFDPAAPNWLYGWSFLSERDVIDEIEGCTDATACNYNPAAIVDDASCTFAMEGFDCDGNALDECNCPALADRTEVIVTDNGSGTGTTTWTCDNVYKLDGYVFVNPGQVLTIEAGTVIKGLAGSGADAAALIVTKGAQIFAEGDADCPIIFTHDADPLDGSGHHCVQPFHRKLELDSTFRATGYIYNDERDFDILASAIEDCVGLLK